MTVKTNALDHVALWVADRDTLAGFLTGHLGMHVIDRTDTFTLVGSDARRGKLTLFDADGPRDSGALERVVLRVRDLDAALAKLPEDLRVARSGPDLAFFEGPEDLGLGLVAGAREGPEYDIDHVVLRVPDPARARDELATLGFERRNGTLAVADKGLQLTAGGGDAERPLLNHIALLVDSADAVREDAERRGLEVADYVDAANTLAVFIWGPDRIKLEYVEHKPGFSLV